MNPIHNAVCHRVPGLDAHVKTRVLQSAPRGASDAPRYIGVAVPPNRLALLAVSALPQNARWDQRV